MIDRHQLISALDELLEPGLYRDYGPNGLQVEGRPQLRKIVSGVTASRALIEAAIAAEADTIFVHHGLFWRGQDGRVTGWLRQRLGLLLANDVNLIAYHLPLDGHPQFGNNAQLAARLALRTLSRFGEQNLGFLGERQDGAAFDNAAQLADYVTARLGRTALSVAAHDMKRPLRRIAWCTGGAQSYFESAIAVGADAFLTGEISEPQAHYARECGVAYIACGHHASERFGAPAVAAHMAARFGLEHEFIDIDNPA